MWLELSLLADAAHAEALSDALLKAGALSVSIEDAAAGTEREQAQFGEPGSAPFAAWEASRLVALFDADAPIPDLVIASAAAAGLAQPPAYSVSEVAEQDWVRLAREQFQPIRISDRLWIVPSWHDLPDPAAINIIVDPGLAFGTGSHPTTRLCLEWLGEAVRGGASVLDYGCGSGILAIAAAKLGAGEVVGLDIDGQALEAAGANAARNDVAMQLLPASARIEKEFDVVVANILTNPLCALAPLLSGRLNAGGRLALCGILETQVEQVTRAFAPFVPLQVSAALDGWVLLEGRRA